MHSVFGLQIGLYSVSLVVSSFLFIVRARYAAGPAFISFLGALVSGIGFGDALLIFFYGRSYNSSFNVFWLLFASISILWLLTFSTVVNQRADWNKLSEVNKVKPGGVGAVRGVVNAVFASENECRFNFSVTGLVFVVVIETGIGYAMHTYYNWGSGAAFTYVFGAFWLNLAVSSLVFGYSLIETFMSFIVTTAGVAMSGAYIASDIRASTPQLYIGIEVLFAVYASWTVVVTSMSHFANTLEEVVKTKKDVVRSGYEKINNL